MMITVDIQVVIVHETDRAIKIKLDGSSLPIWLPLAIVKKIERSRSGRVATITLSEAVAIHKELV